MDVLVVGAGTMGRWFGSIVDAEVTFTDTDPNVAQKAAAAVGGQAIDIEEETSVDVVCVAVPMSVAPTVIERHGPRATEALVDVTGEMEGVVEAGQSVAPDRERASFHPLFAPENAPGNVPVVIDEGGPTVDAIVADIEAAGNAIIETTVDEHDRAMETIQAAAHTAVLAYGIAAEPVPEGFETPVSRQLEAVVEQVTGGNPAVYEEIQAHFDGADRVAKAAGEIATADESTFEQLYTSARIDGDHENSAGS